MTNQWAHFGNQKGMMGDQVVYYKRPNRGLHAGWITWGDSRSGTKLHDYAARGYQPLLEIGQINTKDRDRRAFGGKDFPQAPEFIKPDNSFNKERYIWEQILTHPDGPGMFPVTQLIAMRWYRKENVPVPGVRFPQLAGASIKEYQCPERCGRPVFVGTDGIAGVTQLASHLRITHEWDRTNIQAYGDRVGIDFNAIEAEAAPVVEYEPETEPEELPFKCDECGQTFKESRFLGSHMRSHPTVEVTVT